MFNDLRDFLDYLRETDRLKEVKKEVDPKWEIGAICKENSKSMGYGLVFHKVKGFNTPLVSGVFGCGRDVYAEVLRSEPSTQQLQKRWQEAYKNPIKPKTMSSKDAPCKEVAMDEKEVDLYDKFE